MAKVEVTKGQVKKPAKRVPKKKVESEHPLNYKELTIEEKIAGWKKQGINDDAISQLIIKHHNEEVIKPPPKAPDWFNEAAQQETISELMCVDFPDSIEIGNGHTFPIGELSLRQQHNLQHKMQIWGEFLKYEAEDLQEMGLIKTLNTVLTFASKDYNYETRQPGKLMISVYNELAALGSTKDNKLDHNFILDNCSLRHLKEIAHQLMRVNLSFFTDTLLEENSPIAKVKSFLSGTLSRNTVKLEKLIDSGIGWITGNLEMSIPGSVQSTQSLISSDISQDTEDGQEEKFLDSPLEKPSQSEIPLIETIK